MIQLADTANIYSGTYKVSGSGYFQLTLNGSLTKPIIIQYAVSNVSAQNVMNTQGSNFMIKEITFTKGSRGVRVGPAGNFTILF